MLAQRLAALRQSVAGILSRAARGDGIDRLQALGEMIDRQSEETRSLLRSVVNDLLQDMAAKEASDLEAGSMGTGGMIWMRIYGRKQPEQSLGVFEAEESDVLILNLLTAPQRDRLWTYGQLDFSHQLAASSGPLRFRATMYLELGHVAINFRRINSEVRPFQGLGLHRHVARLLNLEYEKRGLILITGITGSGKSTTLDTIIDANNAQVNGHIVVISDPIEYIHTPLRCVVRQREIGCDVPTFKAGTMQALRQDLDLIVIGEMRDADTIATVLEAADSGHKVITTLHTSSAVESIDRILGESPPSEQIRIRERLASLLTCVISQKLVPSADGRLALAKEIMVCNAPVRAAIRNGHTEEIYQIIQQGGSEGMITMEQDLARLLREGRISYEQAANNANHKKRLDDLVRFQRRL